MTDGPSAYTADAWLNWLAGSATTAPAGLYVQLHTGDPGAAGTANISSVTTRESMTLAAASGGAVSASNTPQWTSWAGTNGETQSAISLWSASTSGTFLDAVTLGTAVAVYTGDTLTLENFSVTFTVAS